MKNIIALFAASHLLISNSGFAQETRQSKDQYNLFNPAPVLQMRQMTTDRPNVTASPLTVDAGHYQVEVGFAEFTNDIGGSSTDSFALIPTKLKVGILNNTDLEVSFIPYQQNHSKLNSDFSTGRGFGDKTIALVKTNLWGNDDFKIEGDSALAILPYLKFPTGTRDLSNDHVEGGLKLPFGLVLPEEFNLGAMAEIDRVYNQASDDYGTNFLHTLTVGHALPGSQDLTGFIEYIGVSPHETGISYQSTASVALVYALDKNWTLDSGYRVGLSNDADNANFFAGTSMRF